MSLFLPSSNGIVKRWLMSLVDMSDAEGLEVYPLNKQGREIPGKLQNTESNTDLISCTCIFIYRLVDCTLQKKKKRV